MHTIEYAVACVAALLVGANIALLVEYAREFVSWWTLKLTAVMFLLVYVMASMLYGNPDESRVAIGVIACVVDVFAFWRVYRAIREAERAETALVVYRPRSGRL